MRGLQLKLDFYRNFWKKTFGAAVTAATFGLISTGLLSGCGGQSNPAAPAIPTTVEIQSGGVEMISRLAVLDVREVVPGKLDYTLGAISCNSTGAQLSRSIKVGYDDTAGQILKNKSSFGPSGYGQCKMGSRDPLQLRLDKSAILDTAKIRIESTATRQTENSPIKIIKVDLYQVAGRAGHEALLAQNTAYPEAGKSMLIRASIVGRSQLTATFTIQNTDGAILSNGTLASSLPGNTGAFQAAITVPSEDFIVKIVVTDKDSNSLSWSTDTYYPATKFFSIFLETAVVNTNGQKLKGVIVGSARSTGEVVVRLFPPSNFTSNWQLQRVNAIEGKQLEIPFELTALGPILQGKGQIFSHLIDPDGKDTLIKTPVIVIANTN